MRMSQYRTCLTAAIFLALCVQARGDDVTSNQAARVFGAGGHFVYGGKTADDAEIYSQSVYGTVSTDAEGYMSKGKPLASDKARTKNLITGRALVPIVENTRVWVVKYYPEISDTSDSAATASDNKIAPYRVWLVKVLDGKHKGESLWTGDLRPCEISLSDSVTIDSTTKHVPLTFDELSSENLWSALDSGDDRTVKGLLLLGRVFMVEAHTSGIVIDTEDTSSWDLVRVRILSGKNAGKAGWTRRKYLSLKHYGD